MKKRWNANTVVVAVLFGIIGLAGYDVVRRMIAGPPPEVIQDEAQAKQAAKRDPDFKVGDPAPDFELPDAQGKKRKLSELVKGETILTFSCGCNACREFQGYVVRMFGEMKGKKLPEVISINSTDPAASEAWMRDTKLKQTMLYGQHTAKEVAAYKGNPCPRAFHLTKDRKVKFIGRSAAQTGAPSDLAMELAQALGAMKG